MKGVIYSEISDFLVLKGITKSFLAKRLAFSREYLNQMLNGKRNMPPETLAKINSILGTSFTKPLEILPHEKLEEDHQSLKDKPLFKDETDI